MIVLTATQHPTGQRSRGGAVDPAVMGIHRRCDQLPAGRGGGSLAVIAEDMLRDRPGGGYHYESCQSANMPAILLPMCTPGLGPRWDVLSRMFETGHDTNLRYPASQKDGTRWVLLADRVDLHSVRRDKQETHNQDARWRFVICNFGGINPHPFGASAPRYGFRTLLF